MVGRIKVRLSKKPFRLYDLNSGTTVISAWWSALDKGLMIDDGAGLISSWTDRVSGLALTATTTARPTWGATSFNSAYAGLTFDGTANCFVTTTLTALPTGANAGEIWYVGSATHQATTAQFVAYGGTAANSARLMQKTNTDAPSVTDRTVSAADLANTCLSPCILKGDWSATVMNGYVNGTLFSQCPATIPSLNTGTTRMRVGAGNGTAAGFVQMVLSDIIITSAVSSTANRQKMEGYLAWNRGLSSVLPASHPYKLGPP